ncbi:MAG: hypothetical protein GY711_28545 [bacterium]|nr:hypothetical protein [bacterium]
MGFFRGLNFARVLILTCLIASCYLGWRAWTEHQQIKELKVALAEGGEVENVVREVQTLSKKYTNLYKQLADENLRGEADPESYIRNIASRDNIELGSVEITPRERPLTRGIVDNTYRITPGDKKATFDKVKIANFLYTLEDASHRVRVTEIRIGVPDRIDSHEYPPDLWTFDCTITSRKRLEGK